jgi:hypothetical protein
MCEQNGPSGLRLHFPSTGIVPFKLPGRTLVTWCQIPPLHPQPARWHPELKRMLVDIVGRCLNLILKASVQARPGHAQLHATFITTVAALWQVLPVIVPIRLRPSSRYPLVRHPRTTPGPATEPRLRASEIRRSSLSSASSCGSHRGCRPGREHSRSDLA